MHRLKLACLMLTAAAAIAQTPKPVSTESGSLIGTEAGGVRSYLGVPFAAPPVGNLRWQPPQPVHRSTAPLPANKPGTSCMQKLSRSHLPWTEAFMVQNDAGEDCLYLNIWAPAKTKNAGVLVFLHGGGFGEGSGSIASYDGASLARRGIIVVDANYRLGIFGFFASSDLQRESPQKSAGNYGLLDQVAAVEWVRRNIGAMGGNPNRVVIVGQSAGGMSVQLLLQSPLLKGKVSGGIIDSGLLAPSVLGISPLSTAAAASDAFEAKHGGSLQALRAIPAADLLAVRDGPPARPVVDGWIVTAPTQEEMEHPVGSDVPVIAGWNADESLGAGSAKGATAEAYRADAAKRYGGMADEFLKLYPATDDATAKTSQVAAARDRNLALAAFWVDEWHAHRKSPAYLYFFTRTPPWKAHPEFGAHHTAELPYFFGTLDAVKDRDYDATDRAVSNSAMSAWVSFVITGAPGGWSAAANMNGPFNIVDQPMSMRQELTGDRADLWRKLLMQLPASAR